MRYILETERRPDGKTFLVDTLNDGRKLDISSRKKEAEFIAEMLNAGAITWESVAPIFPKKDEPKKQRSSSDVEELLVQLTSTCVLFATEIAELKKNQTILIKAVDKLIDLRMKDDEFNLNLNGLSSEMISGLMKNITFDEVIKMKQMQQSSWASKINDMKKNI